MAALAKRGHLRAQQELDGPPLPRGLAYLWRHFCALDRWRGGGGMGLVPLTLHDLAAYQRHYGATLAAPDLDAIKALDAERLLAALPAKEKP